VRALTRDQGNLRSWQSGWQRNTVVGMLREEAADLLAKLGHS
jgi:hypothetical protein